MKEILKKSLSVFGKTIMINFMCFFLVISLSVLSTAAFTEKIGYKAYGVLEGSQDSVELYTYYYQDGEDTEKEKYEEQGYTISTVTMRSEVSKTGNTVFYAVSQLMNLILLCGMLYSSLWQLGTMDSNLVHFKHKAEDKLKGFKIGLIAIIPSVLILLVLTATKSTAVISAMPVALLNFAYSVTFSINNLICGSAETIGDLKIWQLLIYIVLQFIVPAITYTAYILGYKNFSISEKFIYKKNKES